MSTLQVGQYVTYKGVPQMVLAVDSHLVSIINPLKGNVKLAVLPRNLVPMSLPLVPTKELHGIKYLVTGKNCIMKWAKSDPHYKALVA